jgi:hypothetical protein
MYGDVLGGLILSSQLHRVDTRGVLDSRLDCPGILQCGGDCHSFGMTTDRS